MVLSQTTLSRQTNCLFILSRKSCLFTGCSNKHVRKYRWLFHLFGYLGCWYTDTCLVCFILGAISITETKDKPKKSAKVTLFVFPMMKAEGFLLRPLKRNSFEHAVGHNEFCIRKQSTKTIYNQTRPPYVLLCTAVHVIARAQIRSTDLHKYKRSQTGRLGRNMASLISRMKKVCFTYFIQIKIIFIVVIVCFFFNFQLWQIAWGQVVKHAKALVV